MFWGLGRRRDGRSVGWRQCDGLFGPLRDALRGEDVCEVGHWKSGGHGVEHRVKHLVFVRRGRRPKRWG